MDNYFNNKANILYPTGAFTGTWSLPAQKGPNVVGGPYIGGNYWGTPDETGFSDVTPDWNGDGFVNGVYVLPGGIGIDRLPLAPSAFMHCFGTVPVPGTAYGPISAEVSRPSITSGGFTAWKKTYPSGSASVSTPRSLFPSDTPYRITAAATIGALSLPLAGVAACGP